MSQEDNDIKTRRWLPIVVWILRIIVGGTFVMSGLVKAIDLYGFVFKIEEYLAVWNLSQPRSIVVVVALAICVYEFVFGALLFAGCYKRLATWALALTMVVWLPLTGYLWIANPVADCGCFGDFWVLSNFWTFVKNLILSVMLLFLLRYNSCVTYGLYQPAIQWIVGAALSLYIILIALYGYNVQPVADFRPYPIGARLIPETADSEDDNGEMAEDAEEDQEYEFIYEKDGVKQSFAIDNLPDSTWTFVDRRAVGNDADVSNKTDFVVYDIDGEDVTEDAITNDATELLLVIPEVSRIDISYSSFINDLNQWALANRVKMVCLLGGSADDIETWQDLSMATYPIYSVEDTKLKELSRGTMSLVVLRDGVIQSKFTLSSLRGPIFDQGPQGADFLTVVAPQPARLFKYLTIGLGAFLLVIFLFQSLILAVSRLIRRKYQKKSVNLQSEIGATSNGDETPTKQNDETTTLHKNS